MTNSPGTAEAAESAFERSARPSGAAARDARDVARTRGIAHRISRRFGTWSFGELRALGLYATAALLTGGSVSSFLVALVWLFQHYHRREPRT